MKLFLSLLLIAAFDVQAAAIFARNLSKETMSWVSRVNAQGSSVSGSSIATTDYLLNDLQRFGILPSIFRAGCYAGADTNALEAPLILRTSNIWIAPTNDTLIGFTAANYSESTGLTGGTGKYIDTGFVFQNNDQQNSWHLGVYIRTGSDEASHAIGMQTSGGPDTVILVSYAGTSYWDCW